MLYIYILLVIDLYWFITWFCQNWFRNHQVVVDPKNCAAESEKLVVLSLAICKPMICSVSYISYLSITKAMEFKGGYFEENFWKWNSWKVDTKTTTFKSIILKNRENHCEEIRCFLHCLANWWDMYSTARQCGSWLLIFYQKKQECGSIEPSDLANFNGDRTWSPICHGTMAPSKTLLF